MFPNNILQIELAAADTPMLQLLETIGSNVFEVSGYPKVAHLWQPRSGHLS